MIRPQPIHLFHQLGAATVQRAPHHGGAAVRGDCLIRGRVHCSRSCRAALLQCSQFCFCCSALHARVGQLVAQFVIGFVVRIGCAFRRRNHGHAKLLHELRLLSHVGVYVFLQPFPFLMERIQARIKSVELFVFRSINICAGDRIHNVSETVWRGTTKCDRHLIA